MKIWFKTAYILVSVVLLALIWDNVDDAESGTDIISRLMTLRFIGFVALMFVFYYVFFDFLSRRKKEEDEKQ
jgi:hypothetical protein